MKKVLFVFAIAAAFTACNNASETPAPAADTTVVKDTVVAAPVDTTAKPADTTAKPAADTTKH